MPTYLGKIKKKEKDAGRGEVLGDADGNGLDLLQCSGDGSANSFACIIHISHQCLSLASGQRAWIGLVLCMSRGGRKEELASGSTTTAGKSMSRHAGSQRNAPPSRTRPPPHSRHGAVAPPCHKGRLPQLRCRALPAAPCPWTPVAVGAAADGRGRRGTPPPTTKAEPAASCAAAAAATRWRRGTTPPVDIG